MKEIRQILFITSAVMVGMSVAFLTKESISFARSFIPQSFGKVVYLEEVATEKEEVEFKYIERENREIPKISPRYKKINEVIKFPNISSDSYIVADLDTGDIIAYKYPDEIYPIASLSKLMTALVSIEMVPQDKKVIVSRRAVATYGSAGSLSYGDKLKVEELLYPLLLSSSNDAAEAIAEQVDRKHFIGNMNGKAKSIGLLDTKFDDPSGLSSRNVSSARDLFNLTKYIYNKEPKILHITKLKKYDLSDWTWYSNSKFRNDDNYLGGKNGFTDFAEHTLISLFKLPLGENGNMRNIAIVLLKGQTTEKDMRAVTAYLNKNIKYVE